jgi:hypothetical protein
MKKPHSTYFWNKSIASKERISFTRVEKILRPRNISRYSGNKNIASERHIMSTRRYIILRKKTYRLLGNKNIVS